MKTKQIQKPGDESKKFLALKLGGLSSKEAGQEMGWDENRSYVLASRLKDYTKVITGEAGLTPEYVIERLQWESVYSDNSMARIKALESIGKHIGMWENKLVVENRSNETRPLEEVIAEYQKWLDDMKKVVEVKVEKTGDVDGAKAGDGAVEGTTEG